MDTSPYFGTPLDAAVVRHSEAPEIEVAERLARLVAKLTPEQRLFATQYCDTLDAVGAYKLAYPESQASMVAIRARAYALLDRWYIREYMAALCEADGIDAILCTRSEIIERLKELAANGHHNERVKACEILLGQIAPVAPSVNVQINNHNPAGITPERILELREKVLGVPANYSVADTRK